MARINGGETTAIRRSEDEPSPTAYGADYYKGNDQAGDRLALRYYARVARRLAPAGAPALDFGCGMGHLSKRLARRYESWAYDLSPFAREATARTSPQTKVIDDLGALEDGSMGLIVALHVLEHLPEPDETLARFAALLRPGGRLLYVVPDPDGAGHRIRGEEWFAYRDPTHCSLLGREEWLERTRAQGLEVVRAAADGLWDPPYVRWLPRVVQFGTFGLPAAIQVALGRAVLPAGWGECLVVVAERPPGR